MSHKGYYHKQAQLWSVKSWVYQIHIIRCCAVHISELSDNMINKSLKSYDSTVTESKPEFDPV